MPWGLQAQTIEKMRWVFARHPEVESVAIYGSRAKGTYRRGSDIDLTIAGDAVDVDTLRKLINELDDLMLPYTIDLSIKRMIENPALLNHIARVGHTFYTRDCTASKPTANSQRAGGRVKGSGAWQGEAPTRIDADARVDGALAAEHSQLGDRANE